jgi:uridine kinase
LTEKQHEQAANNDYNFDHPDAFDFELLRKTIQRLKHFKNVEVPIYNFITHSRDNRTVSVRKLKISALCQYYISIVFSHRKLCMGPM